MYDISSYICLSVLLYSYVASSVWQEGLAGGSTYSYIFVQFFAFDKWTCPCAIFPVVHEYKLYINWFIVGTAI